MIAAPWICRQCLRRIPRSLQFHRRPATTSTTVSKDTLSPALLSRARATAKEHTDLSQRIATSFDTTSAKRIGELSSIANALSEYEAASESLSELQSLIQDPDSDEELRTLANEDLSTAKSQLSAASQALTTALVPRHPFADLPCLIEVRPGVGGSEAALFAGDLFRMYQAYCSNVGLRAAVLKYETVDGISDPQGSDAPLAEAILEVETKGSYDALRCEAGVHRVQRVPATESKGRTHTSAASVLVLPSFPENLNDVEGAEDVNFDDPNSDYYVNPSDVRTDVMRAKGAGGQHVNTTDSAVRLTHIPTGLVVAIQDSRSQPKNKAKAWQVLRARLAQKKREDREEEMLALRRSVAGGVGKTGRNDKIRTYNWGQQRVTDHRSGITLNGQLDDVIDGGNSLGKIMESVKAWMVERDIEALLIEEQSKSKDSSDK